MDVVGGDAGGVHALLHEDVADGFLEGAVGADVRGGTGLVEELRPCVGGRRGKDTEIACEVRFAGFHLAVELGDGGGGVGEDVDLHLAVGTAFELLLEVRGEARVSREQGDVRAGVSPIGEEGAKEAAAAEEHGDEDGGEEKGLCPDAFEIFAPRDEEDGVEVRHRRSLLRFQ